MIEICYYLYSGTNRYYNGHKIINLLVLGIGAITPDHNLTPTAPTLSYSSSITSLDEYGMEYCRDLTQRNLSQVADALRNGGMSLHMYE